MEEIDVAVFTFDAGQRLRLINRAGERLLGRAAERLLGGTRERTGPRLVPRRRVAARVRAGVPRRRRALGGPAHQLPAGRPSPPAAGADRRQPAAARGGAPGLAAADARARSRDQQLARADQVDRRQPGAAARSATTSPDDWRDDAGRGLDVIASRAEALTRFTASYARLARLPQPRLAPLDVGGLVQRVVGLETRLPVGVRPGPPVTVPGDSDQLEQAAHQPGSQRRRCRRWRPAAACAVGWTTVGRLPRTRGGRRGAGARADGQPVRPVLHDQARRLGHRSRAQPADRRRAQREPDAGQPQRRARLSGGCCGSRWQPVARPDGFPPVRRHPPAHRRHHWSRNDCRRSGLPHPAPQLLVRPHRLLQFHFFKSGVVSAVVTGVIRHAG